MVGDVVTVDLSSLAFSAGEPTGSTVTVSLGDTVLGSAPIDPAIVDTTDEVGRASVQMTVPEGISGMQQLLVTVPETGTAIPILIDIAESEVPTKVDSTTSGSVVLFANHNRTIHYTVTVRAGGQIPTGTVTIYDGRKAVAKVTLTEADNGTAKVALPKLGRGIHILTARYAGSDTVKASTGTPDLLILW